MENGSPAATICRIVDTVSAEVGKTVFGQDQTVRLLTGAFLIGGHVLLEGPPGIAKTLSAKTFSSTLGLKFNRVQFTPDLMPADVTGVTVFDQNSSSFRFSPGPIFADIILADEINRTPPKTQSALLEAMEERFVTVDGERHSLGEFFFVIATQNPIEHEGTFPLPEAQLDRFLFKLNMSYPVKEKEISIIERLSSTVPSHGGVGTENAQSEVVSAEELKRARALLRQITIDVAISEYIYEIASATRQHAELVLGASPRAALNLALAAKLSAALDGRDYVIPDDVKEMVKHVLAHRLVFQPEIFEGEKGMHRLLTDVLNRVPIPARTQA